MKHETVTGVNSYAKNWSRRGLSTPKKQAPQQKTENPFIYVPMGQKKPEDKMGFGDDKKPVHVMQVTSRGGFLSGWLNASNWREYSGGTAYKAVVFGWIFLALTVATYLWFNVYVAAVFAYLTGLMRSQYLLSNAWNLGWFKGKALISTT
jgi:hypothetical protein